MPFSRAWKSHGILENHWKFWKRLEIWPRLSQTSRICSELAWPSSFAYVVWSNWPTDFTCRCLYVLSNYCTIRSLAKVLLSFKYESSVFHVRSMKSMEKVKLYQWKWVATLLYVILLVWFLDWQGRALGQMGGWCRVTLWALLAYQPLALFDTPCQFHTYDRRAVGHGFGHKRQKRVVWAAFWPLVMIFDGLPLGFLTCSHLPLFFSSIRQFILGMSSFTLSSTRSSPARSSTAARREFTVTSVFLHQRDH